MTTDRSPLARRGLLLAVAVLAIAGITWGLRDAPGAAPAALRWQRVDPAPLEHSIGLVGRIEPEKTLALGAPFAGIVAESLVEAGQRVKAGQLLLRMDVAETEVQQRDALSALLKARRAVQELKDWDSGEEMSRARRTLRSAQLAVASTEKKLGQTRALFDRGIIPRNELEDLEQQERLQHLDLSAAERDLARSQARGSGEYLQIAEMELANAEVKHQALRKLLEAKDIKAPFSGIVVAAPGLSLEDAARGPVQAGSQVTQGAPLFGLASIEQLKIVARVSELDVNQLREGMAVDVQGDGFEGEALHGQVSVVGGQALPSTQGGAQFEVMVAIPDLSEEQMRRVRLGMSARLSILAYRNEAAMVVPPEALRNAEGRWLLDYRPTLEQPEREVEVRTGRSTPAGVEVFGLEPGFVGVSG
ncbi:hypothetical protein PSm6_48280 [Pseudomonas solani]|uniref:HlyD family efflux transporter periplasmic adaptor subunit n=1 Tax=Pseudomonas solani TaxID=2731552 RepID=A0AAU7XYT2_9PSED|nr:HlyD family efflux transporter periplasmic adaptor subunit [Pseudomonas solani]EQM67987.1 hypothetical protein L682_20225 [Pseudomonas alcaligenes OT 69]MDN4149389.1 efflux RND transporter periplasmic adaptor subunit [Pseudomonas tohonis]BCD88421.1 hypothetical protein PSm6_48280 [Pseudomonas solani]